jgi:hypothetical protein
VLVGAPIAVEVFASPPEDAVLLRAERAIQRSLPTGLAGVVDRDGLRIGWRRELPDRVTIAWIGAPERRDSAEFTVHGTTFMPLFDGERLFLAANGLDLACALVEASMGDARATRAAFDVGARVEIGGIVAEPAPAAARPAWPAGAGGPALRIRSDADTLDLSREAWLALFERSETTLREITWPWLLRSRSIAAIAAEGEQAMATARTRALEIVWASELSAGATRTGSGRGVVLRAAEPLIVSRSPSIHEVLTAWDLEPLLRLRRAWQRCVAWFRGPERKARSLPEIAERDTSVFGWPIVVELFDEVLPPEWLLDAEQLIRDRWLPADEQGVLEGRGLRVHWRREGRARQPTITRVEPGPPEKEMADGDEAG